MKAIVCTKYGNPEVLQLKEVPKPSPKKDELLVKIHATTVTASDCFIRRLTVPANPKFPKKHLMKLMMRLFIGFTKPRNPILGLVFSGTIESVDKEIKELKTGDEIFGFTGASRGTYAEYKCISFKEIKSGEVLLKPKNASYQEAAAIVYGGVLALHFMRNANLKKRNKVLIYGASGAIGSIAIQIVKHHETEITAVCSPANFELVTSLGAHKTLDYTNDNAISQLEQYDFILDAVGKNKNSTLKQHCKKTLTPTGTYSSVDDSLLKIKPTYLKQLKELVETEKIKAVIDRTYPLEQIVEAHSYVEKGHKKGNVVINII